MPLRWFVLWWQACRLASPLLHAGVLLLYALVGFYAAGDHGPSSPHSLSSLANEYGRDSCRINQWFPDPDSISSHLAYLVLSADSKSRNCAVWLLMGLSVLRVKIRIGDLHLQGRQFLLQCPLFRQASYRVPSFPCSSAFSSGTCLSSVLDTIFFRGVTRELPEAYVAKVPPDCRIQSSYPPTNSLTSPPAPKTRVLVTILFRETTVVC